MKTNTNGEIIIDGKAAAAYLENYQAEWVFGRCSIAVVLREICEEHPNFVRAAVEHFLTEADK